MRTADVQVVEAMPSAKNANGADSPQPPRSLGRFRVQHETIDGMRSEVSKRASAFLKGRPFGITFGEFDPRLRSHIIYVTCRLGK